MTDLPRFLVQAYRKGHSDPWATDGSSESLELAIQQAQNLEWTFKRRVRVIDQDGVTHYTGGPTERDLRKGKV
jgi:hypothetical protein